MYTVVNKLQRTLCLKRGSDICVFSAETCSKYLLIIFRFNTVFKCVIGIVLNYWLHRKISAFYMRNLALILRHGQHLIADVTVVIINMTFGEEKIFFSVEGAKDAPFKALANLLTSEPRAVTFPKKSLVSCAKIFRFFVDI